jgi:hypothetical protein
MNHKHHFIIPLTDRNGDNDGRYLCSGCGQVNTEIAFYKGQPCIYRTGLLCQEGYCSECQVYLDYERGIGN